MCNPYLVQFRQLSTTEQKNFTLLKRNVDVSTILEMVNPYLQDHSKCRYSGSIFYPLNTWRQPTELSL